MRYIGQDIKHIVSHKDEHILDAVNFFKKRYDEKNVDAVRLNYDGLKDYLWYVENKSKIWHNSGFKNFVAIRNEDILGCSNSSTNLVSKIQKPRTEYSIFKLDPDFEFDDGCFIGLYPEEALFNIIAKCF